MDVLDDDILYLYMCVNNYFMHVLNTYKIKKKRKQRYWLKAIHRNRTRLSMETQFAELRAENSEQFFSFLPMSENDFEFLLNKIGPTIAKKDTRFRRAIPAKLRLAITLKFLSTGDTFRSLNNFFKVSHQQISEIVSEVCEALIANLNGMVKLPSNQEDWLAVEHEFKDIFPHCIGIIDGKQIRTTSHFSIESLKYILMTLIDRDFCFLYADISCQKSLSDGHIFRECLLNKKIQESNLNIPSPSPLSDEQLQNVPYVFVADNAFPIKNIMTQYPGDHPVASLERIFNQYVFRVHNIVAENTFGVMSTVFRVLQKPICLEPAKATNVVMTCVLLHNFLQKSRTSKHIYNPHGYTDRFENGEIVPGSWRDEKLITNGALVDLPPVASRSTVTPLQIRNQFAEYFNTF